VSTRDGALLTLALKTGMRQGELAALRWEDIDLTDKPSITVRRSADTRTSKDRRIHIDPPRLEFPEKPRPQGILRHYRTPGYPLASLEQNPAYGTALTFMYANDARF
jgi:integrase